jgi:hypothetical protein
MGAFLLPLPDVRCLRLLLQRFFLIVLMCDKTGVDESRNDRRPSSDSVTADSRVRLLPFIN